MCSFNTSLSIILISINNEKLCFRINVVSALRRSLWLEVAKEEIEEDEEILVNQCMCVILIKTIVCKKSCLLIT